ncbi:MAG: response regulator, partial [Desulfonatronovibrio sp.]
DSFQHDLKSIAADYYVVKSVDLSELIDKVRKILD